MTFIWNIRGVSKPYATEVPRPPHHVEPVDRTQGVAPAGDETDSPSEEPSLQKGAARAYAEASERTPLPRKVFLAKDLMVSPVVTIRADAPWTQAQELIRKSRFRHLPVLSVEGHLA